VKNRLKQAMEKSAARAKDKDFHKAKPTFDDKSFDSLRISESIIEGLTSKGITAPTAIQKTIIPLLLQFPKDNFVFSSSTGSGKTLSYLLPVMQQLQWEEEAFRQAQAHSLDADAVHVREADTAPNCGWFRRESYPRCIILAPTRDLAQQILGEVKSLSHFAKLSSCGVVGGGGKSPHTGAEYFRTGSKPRSLASSSSFAAQKQNLSRKVDIVVATPGRLLQHYKRGNVHLNQISTIIVDEMDTVLLQGFRTELLNLLYCANRAGHNNYLREIQRAQRRAQIAGDPVANTMAAASASGRDVIAPGAPGAPRVVMVTATVTRELKSLLRDSGKGDVLLNSLQEISSRRCSSVSTSADHTITHGILSRSIDALKKQAVQTSEAVMMLPPPPEETTEGEDANASYGAFHSTPFARRRGTRASPADARSVAAEEGAEKLAFQVLQLRDVHQKLPNVSHKHISVGSAGAPLSKLDLLLETLLTRGDCCGDKTQGETVARTMVFCNTIASCRAVDHFLAGKVQELNSRSRSRGTRGQWEYRLLSYHGDLNSSRRTLNLQEFRDPLPTAAETESEPEPEPESWGAMSISEVEEDNGWDGSGQWDDRWGEDMGEGSGDYAYADTGADTCTEPVAWRSETEGTHSRAQSPKQRHNTSTGAAAASVHAILVCTDIAARGLDIPDTDRVLMFDFPMNSIDYIHRAGRTGRAGRRGEVTALVSKRDVILSQGILASIKQGAPLDLCTSDKDDYYMPMGRLHHLMPDITHRVPASKTRPHSTGTKKKPRKVVNLSNPSRFGSATLKSINKADARAEKRRVAASGKTKNYQGSKPSRTTTSSAKSNPKKR